MIIENNYNLFNPIYFEKINDFIENNNKYKCSTFKAIKLTRQFTIENQAEGFISYLKRIELYFK